MGGGRNGGGRLRAARRLREGPWLRRTGAAPAARRPLVPLVPLRAPGAVVALAALGIAAALTLAAPVAAAVALAAPVAVGAQSEHQPAAQADGPAPPSPAGADAASLEARARGWGYLMDKLVADGVDRRRVALVFADPRFPSFTGLRFGLAPREPRSLYRGFLTSASVARARMCRAQHAATFAAAEERFGVQANVVAAILHVESACGRNTGDNRILPPLARLAMAAEPHNLALEIERHGGGTQHAGEAGGAGSAGGVDPEIASRTVDRARELESIFYPEVRAAFELPDRLGVDPLEIRGSASGAFGIPQFLPSSYLRFARDGNGDGSVTLYDHDDAIVSCASYLAAHGWRPGLSSSEKRSVIWTYNRSPAYVDTVLALANRIESPATSATRSLASAARGKSRSGGKSAPTSPKARTQPTKSGAGSRTARE